jgi:hypothetical protein
MLFCLRFYAQAVVTGLQNKRNNSTKGDFLDESNSEVKKNPNSYEVLSTYGVSQNSFRK